MDTRDKPFLRSASRSSKSAFDGTEVTNPSCQKGEQSQNFWYDKTTRIKKGFFQTLGLQVPSEKVFGVGLEGSNTF